MRLYDGKTLDEWREWIAATGGDAPPRVQKALSNSNQWKSLNPTKYDRPRFLKSKGIGPAPPEGDEGEGEEGEGEEAEETGFQTQFPVRHSSQTLALLDQRQEIDKEGTAFLRRYGTINADGNTVITDQVLTELTVVAIKTLYFHAARGELRAAEIIINKCVPEPKQTLDVRVQQMGRAEVEAEKARILAGLAPGVRAALEARLERVAGGEEE